MVNASLMASGQASLLAPPADPHLPLPQCVETFKRWNLGCFNGEATVRCKFTGPQKVSGKFD